MFTQGKEGGGGPHPVTSEAAPHNTAFICVAGSESAFKQKNSHENKTTTYVAGVWRSSVVSTLTPLDKKHRCETKT